MSKKLNINDERFDDGQPQIFNNGLSGIVEKCTVAIEKRGDDEPVNRPIYRLVITDSNESTINKGFFNSNPDKPLSEKGKTFAINELKHLLKTFGHKVDEKGNLVTEEFDGLDDFMDYTMSFINKAEKGLYDVVVDYGTEKWPRAFLQLNGFPWYIKNHGDEKVTLSLRNGAKVKRVVPSDEEVDDNISNSETVEKEWEE